MDNFPGFPDGITGPQLMTSMREQGARWGAIYETEDVEEVDLSARPFVIRSSSREVKTQTVIIATGELQANQSADTRDVGRGRGCGRDEWDGRRGILWLFVQMFKADTRVGKKMQASSRPAPNYSGSRVMPTDI